MTLDSHRTAWRILADGIEIAVRLTPNAHRDALNEIRPLADGVPVLAAQVRAVPEKGAANKALERMLAARLGVAPSRVAVVRGTTSRRKLVHVAGKPAVLIAALEAALASATKRKAGR